VNDVNDLNQLNHSSRMDSEEIHVQHSYILLDPASPLVHFVDVNIVKHPMRVSPD
jgi:hypothetical protein